MKQAICNNILIKVVEFGRLERPRYSGLCWAEFRETFYRFVVESDRTVSTLEECFVSTWNYVGRSSDFETNFLKSWIGEVIQRVRHLLLQSRGRTEWLLNVFWMTGVHLPSTSIFSRVYVVWTFRVVKRVVAAEDYRLSEAVKAVYFGSPAESWGNL